MGEEKAKLGTDMYVQVLGCGSARPTRMHNPSAQVVRIRDKAYLLDCGEGTQMRMIKYGAPLGNLHRIFISHLHGDHVLGLPGLLSTLSISGLDYPMHIYGPRGVGDLVEQIIRFWCYNDRDRIVVHELAPKGREVVYEDGTLAVSAFPLVHRVATIGYRFDEHQRARPLKLDMADFYGVPIAYFNKIKQGADYVRADGSVVPNHLLTGVPPTPSSYAYCSDTAYSPQIVPWVKGVQLLYHEATFDKAMVARAKETLHSTSEEAAQIATAAEVGQLLIGHYSARFSTPQLVEQLRQEAALIFPNTVAAVEGGIYSANGHLG